MASPEDEMSRRQFLDRFRKTVVGATAAVLLAEAREGIALNPPGNEITFQVFGQPIYDAAADNPRAINVAASLQQIDQSHKEKYKVLSVAKRALNSVEGIDNAFSTTVNLLDGDLVVIRDKVYLEHGFVPDWWGFRPPFVIDPAEQEIYAGLPHLLANEGLAYMASKNRYLPKDQQKGALIQLKRGDFTPHIVQSLLEVVEQYHIETYFFQQDVDRVERAA